MNRRMSLITGLVVLLALLLGAAPAGVAQAQDQRCFPETGLCIAGPIRTYWERNGGLPIFGFPITAQAQETVEGRSLQVQWFERDRIEIQADGSITTGRLGVERLEQMGTPWQRGNKTSRTPDRGCIAFDETGHQVCGGFAQFWRANGDRNRLGLPITGEFQQTLGDGRTYTVQYFERRRMELHPENAPPFNILLGLLGREVLDGRTPADPCAQIPANVNADITPRCGRIGTVFNDARGFGFQPGERVGAYLTAPTQEVFGARFQLEADRNGEACCVRITSGGFPNDPAYQGIWAITFEGVRSGRRAIAYFRIIP